MKSKKKDVIPRTPLDIKIFILFLLDRIRYPIDRSSLINIISENTDSITLNYDECLGELARDGHVYFDEIDGERYYMISEKGRAISAELYDGLDPSFRERSIRSVAKHLSLENAGIEVGSRIEQLSDKRYSVTLTARAVQGEIMSLTLTVASLAEAEEIRDNYGRNPTGVYRGILFSATGRMEFLS